MVRPLLFVTAFLVAAPALADRTVPSVANPNGGTLDDLLPRIAARLTAEKSHAQLRDFPGAPAIVYFNPAHAEVLRYQHGVTEVPNPDYARKVREAEAEDRRYGPRLRGAIPKMVPRYDPKTGIDLSIEIFPDGGMMLQRVIMPIGAVGEAKIELRLTCPDPALAARITEIVREEIRRTRGGKLS
jgi:hypothetical protein